MTRVAIRAERIFDGTRFRAEPWLLCEDGHVIGFAPEPQGDEVVDLGAGVLAPGFLDLQVNGGGGVMVSGRSDAGELAAICEAHGRLGATGILPTLITDTFEATSAVIEAGLACRHAGILGLHLEGPHLDPRRKGAHDAAKIRPMEPRDLALLCEAARTLPALIVTLAPEAATLAQIEALAAAGAIVSLGHSDCTYDEAMAAFGAGARMATHLFNAMSGLSHRAPGLVGAVLSSQVAAGVIADGVHLLPPVLQIALGARPEGLVLVSDAMAVAGTSATEFSLQGRPVLRRNGRLELEDGTLAGADISLPQSVKLLISLGIAPERALAMASRLPAQLIGAQHRGRLVAGARADLVHLGPDWDLAGVWRSGARI